MAEFKEFERRFKFKPRFKYEIWLVPLKIVSNVSRFKPALHLNRVLADFGGFKPRLKFFKFGHRLIYLGITKLGFTPSD